MCVVAAAFGYLDKNETVNFHMQITPWQMFTWLTCSGMIGVVFTVLIRRHFVDDPKMIFADGVAAAETIQVLDAAAGTIQVHGLDPEEAGPKIRALGYAALASAAVTWLRESTSLLPTLYLSQPYRAGFEWNLLNVGSGLLVGLNVGMSMLLGTLVITYLIGPWIIQSGIGQEIVHGQIAAQYWDVCQRLVAIADPTPDDTAFLSTHCDLLQSMHAHKYFPIVLLWAMWPATGLMVASAMMAIVIRWRSIVDTFRNLRMQQVRKGEDMSLKAVLAWAFPLTIALALIQQAHFGMSILQTIVAVLASLPLMLVGIRVLGETNNGPISAMANALQALFAVFWPIDIGSNLIAAGMAGNISSQAEGTIQDFKTGKIIGSTPRILTYVQLAAVPIGAAAVAIMYPLVIHKFGLGGEGLTAPTGIKLANMAALLSRGFDALPQYALVATIVGGALGIAVAIVRAKSHAAWVGWIPSVAAFGFALILPGDLNIPVAAGGVAGWVWMKLSPQTYARYAITVASGMIAGEALLGGLVLPVLAALGVNLG
jgi:OPT family oligopeptide transporter